MPSKNPKSESSESSVQFQLIEIAKIRRDGGTQPRAQLYEEVVADYLEDMRQGAKFPPVTVFFDGEEYWLADGFHRVQAKENIGAREVTAEVHTGTHREAVLFAAGANATHGLRRTNADKRRAVERLLRDREWSKWSNVEIAKRCQVDEKTVRRVKKQLLEENPQLDIDPNKRIAMRDGIIIEIDTTNIGSRPQSEAKNSPKRKRTKKQPATPAPLTIQSKRVKEGDTWKLGKHHYLFCGNSESDKFQRLLPSEIALLLFFPRTKSPWLSEQPVNVQNALLFYTSHGEDFHLETIRTIIENCLSGTTDAGEPVVMINLIDPSLFILIDELQCHCYCAEPDPQRCTDALTAWSITNKPAKRLSPN